MAAGRSGCAAIDVFGKEPLPANSPLRDPALIDTGRLIPTPHIGYGALQTYETMYRETAENLRAWASGEVIRVLNK